MKRTDMNWSNHVLEIIEIDDNTSIHDFGIPGRKMNRIKFINTCDRMMVTGDYGTWVFDREFHPSPEGSVRNGYWLEKLEDINTGQTGKEFDPEGTLAEIDEMMKECAEENGIDLDDEWNDNETYQYLKTCKRSIEDGEMCYLAHAYGNYPSNMDYECVPHIKKVKYHLLVIFDAFEEICRRLKVEDDRQVKTTEVK